MGVLQLWTCLHQHHIVITRGTAFDFCHSIWTGLFLPKKEGGRRRRRRRRRKKKKNGGLEGSLISLTLVEIEPWVSTGLVRLHIFNDLLLCLSVIAFISSCSMLSSEALSAGVGSDLKTKIDLVSEHHTDITEPHFLVLFLCFTVY